MTRAEYLEKIKEDRRREYAEMDAILTENMPLFNKIWMREGLSLIERDVFYHLIQVGAGKSERLSHKQIAEASGKCLRTIYRAFSRLLEKKLIKQEAGLYRVVDAEELHARYYVIKTPCP